MSRFGNRMPRNFDVDAYMTRLWGDSKAGPIGKAPLPVPIVGETAELPDIFQAYCIANGLPQPIKEYTFAPPRRYRWDYAYVANLIAIELDGGVWTQGRHTRGAGFIEDQHKCNLGVKLGWRILRYTHERYSEAVADLKIMLAKEAA